MCIHFIYIKKKKKVYFEMKLKSIWVSAQMYIYKNTILIQFKYHGILNMIQYNRIYTKHCDKKNLKPHK